MPVPQQAADLSPTCSLTNYYSMLSRFLASSIPGHLLFNTFFAIIFDVIAAQVPSIARRHVAQATGDWGAADSQSAFDSRFTDAPSGLWESGLSGPLALDNSSPLIDEALAFGWRAQSKRQEEEGGDRSDGIFSWPHRPLQGSGGVQVSKLKLHSLTNQTVICMRSQFIRILCTALMLGCWVGCRT